MALGHGALTGSGLSILQITECASNHGSAARRSHAPPMGDHPLLRLPVSRQPGTRHRETASGSGSGRASLAGHARHGLPNSVSLISESLGAQWCGPGRRQLPGNETPDACLAPARISFGPTWKRGTRSRNPAGKRPGGLSGQLVTPPGPALTTRPCLRPHWSGEWSALPRSGQNRCSLRGGALDRGYGAGPRAGTADSRGWTCDPGRDFHDLDGSCPPRAVQPA